MNLTVNMDTQSKNKILHFMVQDVRMCAYLDNVSQVLPLMALKKVPGSPGYLAGLMNLKGKSIQTIDLAMRTGLTRHEKYSLDSPVLLCQYNDNKVGFIVDQVIGLTEINKSSLQMPEEFNKQDSIFIASVIDDSEPSLLLNMANLIGKP